MDRKRLKKNNRNWKQSAQFNIKQNKVDDKAQQMCEKFILELMFVDLQMFMVSHFWDGRAKQSSTLPLEKRSANPKLLNILLTQQISF